MAQLNILDTSHINKQYTNIKKRIGMIKSEYGPTQRFAHDIIQYALLDKKKQQFMTEATQKDKNRNQYHNILREHSIPENKNNILYVLKLLQENTDPTVKSVLERDEYKNAPVSIDGDIVPAVYDVISGLEPKQLQFKSLGLKAIKKGKPVYTVSGLRSNQKIENKVEAIPTDFMQPIKQHNLPINITGLLQAQYCLITDFLIRDEDKFKRSDTNQLVDIPLITELKLNPTYYNKLTTSQIDYKDNAAEFKQKYEALKKDLDKLHEFSFVDYVIFEKEDVVRSINVRGSFAVFRDIRNAAINNTITKMNAEIKYILQKRDYFDELLRSYGHLEYLDDIIKDIDKKSLDTIYKKINLIDKIQSNPAVNFLIRNSLNKLKLTNEDEELKIVDIMIEDSETNMDIDIDYLATKLEPMNNNQNYGIKPIVTALLGTDFKELLNLIPTYTKVINNIEKVYDLSEEDMSLILDRIKYHNAGNHIFILSALQIIYGEMKNIASSQIAKSAYGVAMYDIQSLMNFINEMPPVQYDQKTFVNQVGGDIDDIVKSAIIFKKFSTDNINLISTREQWKYHYYKYKFYFRLYMLLCKQIYEYCKVLYTQINKISAGGQIELQRYLSVQMLQNKRNSVVNSLENAKTDNINIIPNKIGHSELTYQIILDTIDHCLQTRDSLLNRGYISDNYTYIDMFQCSGNITAGLRLFLALF
jgi:hypothetical protein